MEIKKFIPYLMKGAAAGIAAGLLLTFFLKNDQETERPVVELKEVSMPSNANSNADFSGPVSYSSAVEAAAPAVVNIHTTKVVTRQVHPFFNDPTFRHFFGDNPAFAPKQRSENSLGSGVIISESGFVLTNNHVISGADEIFIAFRDGTNAQASVVGTDPETDLAVLQIANAGKLPSITIDSSDTLSIGDVVLAIGNPFGVGQTVTMGIVSATGRNQLGISTFENFIQTDAAINPGNSGGALVNAHGHLVGINTAIFSRSGGSQGIGFAIPASLAKVVMQQIIEYGRVVRGWLGVEAQDITPALAESFNLKQIRGVLIAGVIRNGPAAQAGIKPGDIVLEIGSVEINKASELINAVASIPPESKVEITMLRNNREIVVTPAVGERPKLRN